MTQDLEGVLVVGLEHAVAAPFCTAQLADAGARVIKVERPEGDFARGYDTVVKGGSAYFVWLNRGKESIALDLRDPADKALLERIVARADVFVQNLGPGQAARLGFGAADLAARHPRLVTCDISGYGEAGPYAGMKAYDLLVQAETGLCSITGAPEAPGRVGISLADVATGATAHGAILRALYRRERTGRGAVLKTSLFDTLADWMSVPLLHQVYGGKAPPRVGIRHPSIAPYGAYALGDGSQIVISIQNEREWVRFCAAILDEPALATDPRFATMTARVANRAALDARVGETFATMDRAVAAQRLSAAAIAYGMLNSVADFASHPALRRVPVDTPNGSIDLVAPPVRVDEAAAAPGPVPALGEHTQAIREEFAA